ncbi:unnamed protein product [Microthlaspi erraticum]|uniref:F-box domain-containing protein n=1 Tax=Microthlaspi erraticum TaxID=1685480 RepID=A0A6D2KWM0_9BRAS|nr:unnamed protein product [Microthlaspi erraticum]
MSSPERIKRRKQNPPPTPQSTPNPPLPYDLLLSCIARVSRLYYPTLALVSKSFRSLIASPELYKTRSLLSRTESCLYVCIQSSSASVRTWYTLCRKPNKTLSNETKSSGYILARVPVPESSWSRHPDSGLVAVGSDIYNIGGSDFLSMASRSLSRVRVLDCRSHTWSEAPSLPVALCLFSATVVDRKIYVAGWHKDGGSGLKNVFQVLDTEAQVWDILPSYETRVFFRKTASNGGNFHVLTTRNEEVAYDPKVGRWDAVESLVDWWYRDCCEIGNVLYAAGGGVLVWYDTEERRWRKVTGLVGLPELNSESRVKLADYGRKMGLLWQEEALVPWVCVKKKLRGEPWPRVRYTQTETKIWCAEIALERRNSCEIWGKVEWLDHVLTVPSGSKVMTLLAATL